MTVHLLIALAGIIESLICYVIVACGIAQIVLKSRLYVVAHAIWTGVFFLGVASLAIAGAVVRWRALYVAHAVTALVASLIVSPCLICLLLIELFTDSWYHFWSTDQEICQNGCYSKDGTYVRTDYGSWWWSNTAVNGMPQQTGIGCNSDRWIAICHQNTPAVQCEMIALIAVGVTSVIFLISACLAGCVGCRAPRNKQFIHPSNSAISSTDQPDMISNGHARAQNTNWILPYYNTVYPSKQRQSAHGFALPQRRQHGDPIQFGQQISSNR